jgi:signal transduction histidine kinase
MLADGRKKAGHGFLGRIRSVSTRLSILVAFSAALPLALVGGLSILLARYSFEKTALGQILDALEGAHSIVSEYHSLVSLGVMSEARALSFIRRLFLGDLVELSVLAESAEDGERFFSELARYRAEGALAPYGLPERFPVAWSGSRAVLTEFLPLLTVKQAIDNMPLAEQAELANGKRQLRQRYNLKAAAVRIRESGYVFAISGSEPGSASAAYELFHPTLTMVDVSSALNSRGEPVGKYISMRRGERDTQLPEPYLRYEYLWMNDGDPKERRKITLLRYYEPWNMVIAAGLYEDEYFAPLRSLILSVLAGLVGSGALFLILAKAMGRSLIGKRVEELSAAFAQADSAWVTAFPVEWTDEFGSIARAAERMTKAIQEREFQMRQAQKHEIAGTIAAGMAHDMNNLLGGILGTTSLLKADAQEGRMPTQAELAEAISMIEKSTKSASLVIRRLLDFGKAQEEAFRPLRLAKVVEESLAIAERSSPPEVLYAWTKGRDLPAQVRGDAVRLEQVCINLLLNARDALTIMREDSAVSGGTVIIELEEGALSSGAAAWALTIRDDGVGMDAETLSRAFEAFYSNKPGLKGSGLGLAMVRNIVQQHGGELSLDSKLGEGSAVRVVLARA